MGDANNDAQQEINRHQKEVNEKYRQEEESVSISSLYDSAKEKIRELGNH